VCKKPSRTIMGGETKKERKGGNQRGGGKRVTKKKKGCIGSAIDQGVKTAKLVTRSSTPRISGGGRRKGKGGWGLNEGKDLGRWTWPSGGRGQSKGTFRGVFS